MSGQRSGVAEAYDRFAPVYNDFNAQNDYEVWLGQTLLPELAKHGLREPSPEDPSGRALDVGCGTGRAFDPLLRRGWQIVGVDASAGMLEEARKQAAVLGAGDRVSLAQVDARELPVNPEPFDLILALNDVINYLTEDGDLKRAFSGMRKNLAPHGLICFDANCMSLFEANWLADREAPIRERGFDWRGVTSLARTGGVYEAEVSGESFEMHRHRERHWPPADVEVGMKAAGLQVLAARGLREDPEAHRIFLDPHPDEHSHQKLIYIGGHDVG